MRHVAYTLSGDRFIPLVAEMDKSGVVNHRELLKSDLDNIRGTDDPIKGGWLMKGTSVGNSWLRRYALIRGNFLFYFQSASADKPQGVIPLEVSFIEYCYFLIL